MKVLRTVDQMKALSLEWRSRDYIIGLVPTMGFFHQGHLALMDKARSMADRVVVSLFVNPTQFGPNEDLDRYPRNFEKDKYLATEHDVDCIFFPDAEEMYHPGFQTWVEVTDISQGLCGAFRPGHFRGVATVVLKLFNIVQPDFSVFGLKDYQQVQVIKRMVEDLNIPVKIVTHPIIREPDGLAMSSRNAYLSKDERKSALCLYNAIKIAENMVKNGCKSTAEIKKAVKEHVLSYPYTRIDYIFVGNPETLEEQTVFDKKILLALAVHVGKTRLIDNAILES